MMCVGQGGVRSLSASFLTYHQPNRFWEMILNMLYLKTLISKVRVKQFVYDYCDLCLHV